MSYAQLRRHWHIWFREGSRSTVQITRRRFVARVREALTAAGVDSSAYSGHIFRSGAATKAAKCGVSDTVIKMLGRWKSSAYQLYIKTPRANGVS